MLQQIAFQVCRTQVFFPPIQMIYESALDVIL